MTNPPQRAISVVTVPNIIPTDDRYVMPSARQPSSLRRMVTATFGGLLLLTTGAVGARADTTPVPTTTRIQCTSPVSYTGQPQTPCQATVSAADGSKTWDVPVSYPYNHTDAGTVNVSAGMGDVPGYAASINFGSFTIAKAPTSASLGCPTVVAYTGAAVEPCTATLTYDGVTNALDVRYEHNVGPGKALAYAMFPGDTNHEGAGGSASFLIGSATTVVLTCTAGSVYTGSPVTPCTATATSGAFSTSVPVTYVDNTDAGTATASAEYAGDGTGGHLPGSSTTTFTIARAPSTTTVTCPASVVYTGAALAPCTYTVTSVGVGQGPASLFASYAHNTDVTGTGPKATFTVAYSGDGNHLGSTGSGSFDITPAPVVVTVACPPSADYTGAAVTPCTAAVTGAGGLATTAPVTYTGNTFVGTATASATFPGDGNHLSGTGTTTFQVKGFTFTGYNAPVVMGAWNRLNGGSTVPLTFTAFGPNGTEVTTTAALGATVTLTPVTCTATPATATATGASFPAATPGRTTLGYASSIDAFYLNWKTPTTPGCHRLTATTADHSTLSAYFQLR